MCGICGIVHFDPEQPVPHDDLLRMRDVLTHRGPDDAGTLVERGVGLGHRRLSILDLSERARQPMSSANGRFCITYNGVIYNFWELRGGLESLGHGFRTTSDTEVLVEGLDEWGIRDLLPRLDGIFAFAAWDRTREELIVACDPLGVKPAFYHENGRSFYFASEMKALWAAGVPREFAEETLEELLVFRTVAGPETPFRGIRRVMAGHFLIASARGVESHPYWCATDHVGDDPAAADKWKQLFVKAVRDQQVSDVPIGTLLSGGMDSSTVTAELARSVEDASLQTFTVSVPPDEGVDEWPYAEQVARRWNCRAHQLRVPSGDVLDRLCEAQTYHDEPLAHGNDMHIFELSRMAQRHVKVLLSGEGADETLGGYVRYQPVRSPRLLSLVRSPIGLPLRIALAGAQRRQLRSLNRVLSFDSLDSVMLYNAADLLPEDLRTIGFAVTEGFAARRRLLDRSKEATPQPLKQLMLYDIQTFLRSILNRNDRMTMGASIECRVPFLSVGLVQAALKIPPRLLFKGRQGKQVLRDHAASLLPQEVLQRPKWGLGIPWGRYFRDDPACRAFVTGIPRSTFGEVLGAPGLTAVIEEFLSGDDRRMPLVYQIFALAVWWNQIVEGLPVREANTPVTPDAPRSRTQRGRAR